MSKIYHGEVEDEDFATQGGIWECPVTKSGHCQDSHRPATQAEVASPGTHQPRVPVLGVGYILCWKIYKVQRLSGLSGFLLQHVPVPVHLVGSWSGPVVMFLDPLR